MASEIRVNDIKNRSGLGTVTFTDTGLLISGITSFSLGNTNLIVGSATSTGTASQLLQVTGGAYVSGNVGLGTTNPVSKLHIQDGSDGLRISATAVEQTSSSGLTLNGSNASGFIAFRVAGNERARVTSTGSVQIANGNLVFSTAGTGIDFSATANSSGSMSNELLDDYEFGTWSPVLTASTPGSGSFSGTANAYGGHYVKIGKMVYISANLRGNWTLGSASGDIRISGLPFTVASGSSNGWNACFSAINIPYHTGFTPDTGYVITGGMVLPASDQIAVYQVQTASASNPTLGITRVTAGTDTINVHFSGCYLAT